MGDIWTALGKALDRQAATQASIDAVEVKAAEEREVAAAAKKAAAAEEKAKKRAAPAKKTPAEKAAAAEAEGGSSGGEGQALWEMQGNEEVHARAHLRAQRLERRFCKDCGGSGLCEQHGRRRDRCKD